VTAARPDFSTGAALALAGIVVVLAAIVVAEDNHADQAPTPAPTITRTVTPPPVTETVTVRVTQRASRSEVRTTAPTTQRIARPDTSGAVVVTDPGTPSIYQAYARARVSSDQWPCLRTLVQRESSWRPTAVNGSHYGLFQMRGMKHGTGWKHQIVRGLDYIDYRYGSPCAALAHSNAKGWY
jgi:hypothetical protein